MTVEEMKNVDVRTVDRNTLVDLNTVEIDMSKPVEERRKDFIRQVKNPYCFKVGDVAVKVSFTEDGSSFEERFQNMLRGLH